jgi:hypothetical protein
MAPITLTPLQPPHPSWYKLELTYEYHSVVATNNNNT